MAKKILMVLVCVVLAASAVSAESTEPTRSYGAVDVILYETAWCPYCVKAGQLLKDMGVSLVRYDIEEDETKRSEMLAKSGGSRGVPVIDVEGIILRGYSAEAIRSAVESRRRK